MFYHANDNTTNAKAGDGYLNELHKMGGNWRKGEKEEDTSEHVAGSKEDVEELHVENGNLGNNVNKKKKLKKRKKNVTNMNHILHQHQQNKEKISLLMLENNAEMIESYISSSRQKVALSITLPSLTLPIGVLNIDFGVTVASDCLAGLIVAYKPVASLTPRTKPKAPPLSPVLTKIRFQPARN